MTPAWLPPDLPGAEFALRDLNALAAPHRREPALGCSLVAHRDLGFCAGCAPEAQELDAWRLLAMVHRGIPRQSWEHGLPSGEVESVIDDLPGLWERADLVGGETDHDNPTAEALAKVAELENLRDSLNPTYGVAYREGAPPWSVQPCTHLKAAEELRVRTTADPGSPATLVESYCAPFVVTCERTPWRPLADEPAPVPAPCSAFDALGALRCTLLDRHAGEHEYAKRCDHQTPPQWSCARAIGHTGEHMSAAAVVETQDATEGEHRG